MKNKIQRIKIKIKIRKIKIKDYHLVNIRLLKYLKVQMIFNIMKLK